MKYMNIITSFFFLLVLFNLTKSFYVSKNEEINNRLLTEDSMTKLSNNLYMINYTNDYYFEDLLNKGSKDYIDLFTYVYSRFGSLYEFNISPKMSFSCSAFNVFNNENQNLFGRNFDNPYSPSFMIWTHPKNKYKSVTFVLGLYLGMNEGKDVIKDKLLLLPYAPLDGLNEHGFGIAVLVAQQNYSNHQTKPGKLNLTTTLMIRGVLDNCKTTDEAIDFFDKYNMHDINEGISYHFFMTDKEGHSAVIEYVDGEMIVIENKKSEGNNHPNYLYVTNFYLAKEIKEGNNHGLDRYIKLEEKLKNEKITMDWKKSMDLLISVSQNSTVWSNVFNTNDLSFITAYKRDYENLYKCNVLEPMSCTKVNKE